MELFPPLCLSSSFFSIYFRFISRFLSVEWKKIFWNGKFTMIFTAGFIMEDLFRNAVDIICNLSSLVIILSRE